MYRYILYLFPLLLISGCSAVNVATGVARGANDTALEKAEKYVCHGTSVGAIKRRYGANVRKFRAWDEFCS